MNVGVSFEDGGVVVDGPLMRPVRLLPDGVHAGVVYGGAVYPLRVGNTVELRDATYPKTDCTQFASEGTALSYLVPTTDTTDERLLRPEGTGTSRRTGTATTSSSTPAKAQPVASSIN